jgi:hypothetical protein
MEEYFSPSRKGVRCRLKVVAGMARSYTYSIFFPQIKRDKNEIGGTWRLRKRKPFGRGVYVV